MASYATKLKKRYKALSNLKGREYNELNTRSKAVMLTEEERNAVYLAQYMKGVNSNAKNVTARGKQKSQRAKLEYIRGLK